GEGGGAASPQATPPRRTNASSRAWEARRESTRSRSAGRRAGESASTGCSPTAVTWSRRAAAVLRNRPVNDFFPGLRTRWRCCAFAAALTLALAGCGPAPPVPGDSPAAAQLTMEAQQLASMGRVNEAMARLAEAKRAD